MSMTKPILLVVVALLIGCSSDTKHSPSATADSGTDAASDANLTDTNSDASGSSDSASDISDSSDGAMAADSSDSDTGRLERCDPGVGLRSPVPACSAAEPCTDLLGSYARRTPPIYQLDTPSSPPLCQTTEFGTRTGHPVFDDGVPRSAVMPSGETRYWCETRVPRATTPRPLIVFIPGSGGSSSDTYDTSLLRQKQPTFDLSGEPTAPGYVLVSIQPRNLHWPTVDAQEGTKSDSLYRDLGSPSTNPDIAFLDSVIDSLVEEGVVDPSRIYLMGWSNGARFSILYGIARHETATPKGNKVAAVANYSGGDPFAPPTFADADCQATSYPTSAIPYYLVSRACDVIACDAAQDSGVVPGNVVEPWVAILRDVIGADVTWQRLGDDGANRDSCAVARFCGPGRQLANHIHWPDGLSDNGGVDHEPTMLEFLRTHPLSQ